MPQGSQNIYTFRKNPLSPTVVLWHRQVTAYVEIFLAKAKAQVRRLHYNKCVQCKIQVGKFDEA